MKQLTTQVTTLIVIALIMVSCTNKKTPTTASAIDDHFFDSTVDIELVDAADYMRNRIAFLYGNIADNISPLTSPSISILEIHTSTDTLSCTMVGSSIIQIRLFNSSLNTPLPYPYSKDINTGELKSDGAAKLSNEDRKLLLNNLSRAQQDIIKGHYSYEAIYL